MYQGHYPETGVVHLHFEDLQIVRVPEAEGDQIYDGEYSVTPSTDTSTVLAVKGKWMSDDIVIEPVPTYEVENLSGGITKVIGVKE